MGKAWSWGVVRGGSVERGKGQAGLDVLQGLRCGAGTQETILCDSLDSVAWGAEISVAKCSCAD